MHVCTYVKRQIFYSSQAVGQTIEAAEYPHDKWIVHFFLLDFALRRVRLLCCKGTCSLTSRPQHAVRPRPSATEIFEEAIGKEGCFRHVPPSRL